MHWIRRHRRGRPPHPDVLTPAEWRVVDLARAGRSNPEIAEELGITVPTVKTHMSRILDKLDVPDRRALAAWDGRPAVEVPRRSGMFASVGWLTSKAVGGVAATAGAAVLLVGFVIAMESGRVTGGTDLTPTPSATATETPPPEAPADSAPAFAPGGRTGDQALDDLIDSLARDDAEGLAQRFAGLDAREWFAATQDERTYAASEWAARLADAERSLFAVQEGHPQAAPAREFQIVLAVTEAGSDPVEWRFAVQDGRLVDVVVGSSSPDAGGVVRGYDDYLVLPPEDALPQPPPGNALDVRSGDAEVDALLAMIEARDAGGLAAAVEYERRACESGTALTCPPGAEDAEVDGLRLRACNGNDRWLNPRVAGATLERVARTASALHAVVEVPDGYLLEADHLVTLITQVEPYRWESAGIFERDGRIVGLHTQCYSYAEGMYPPSAFVLPPPSDGADIDVGRASGLPVVDGTLMALRAGDTAALDALVDWGQVGCVPEQQGIGAPPQCEAGEEPGTLIDVLPVVGCEGAPRRRAEVGEMWENLADPGWGLYSVADLGTDAGFPPGTLEAILVRMPPSGDVAQAGVLGLSFTEDGLASVRFGCGPRSPEALMSPGRAPAFLVAPPP